MYKISKRKARPVSAIVVAVGILVLLTSRSHAYDRRDCDYLFGAANVYKAQQFKFGGGSASFGDHPHLGGAPQGTAVVCWCTDGRVAIKGHLFSDGGLGGENNSTGAKLRFFRSNGSYWPYQLSTPLGNGVQSTLVYVVAQGTSFNKIRIRLYDTTPATLHPTDGSSSGSTWHWLKTKLLYR